MKLHLSETSPVSEDFRDITDQVSLYLLYTSGQVFLDLLYH